MDFERTGRFRATFLCGVLFVLFALLAVRLAHIQIFEAETYATGARRQQVSRRELPALRGPILDRHGFPLAISVPARSLHADPGEVDDVESAAARYAPLLGIPERDLVSLLGRPGRFAWIHRRVEDRDLLRRITKLDLPWIGQTYEPARRHPAGRMAAHVLGFTGDEGRGLEGMEAVHEDCLKPHPGYRLEERDGTRRGVRIVGTLPGARAPCAGRGLTLTIDRRIQAFVEEAMDALVEEWQPHDAVALVLDPRTGDVLASAARPDFDPDRFKKSPRGHWKNRVVVHAYPPGSSFKPIVAAVAMEAGTLTADQAIDCENGSWRLGRSRIVKDTHPMGVVPFADALVQSSNVAMVKVGRDLGAARLRKGLAEFGIGTRTRCGIPNEAEGVLRPLVVWNGATSLRSVSIGQEVSVTALQLARAYCALATDGRAPRPRYVLSGSDPERVRLISAKSAATLRAILGRIVEEGTGKRAKLERWRVGGKTGTADRFVDGRKAGYVSVFVGLAPVSNPRFVVVVMADRARTDKGTPYGGRVAAPAVRSILDRSLRLYGVPSDAP